MCANNRSQCNITKIFRVYKIYLNSFMNYWIYSLYRVDQSYSLAIFRFKMFSISSIPTVIATLRSIFFVSVYDLHKHYRFFVGLPTNSIEKRQIGVMWIFSLNSGQWSIDLMCNRIFASITFVPAKWYRWNLNSRNRFDWQVNRLTFFEFGVQNVQIDAFDHISTKFTGKCCSLTVCGLGNFDVDLHTIEVKMAYAQQFKMGWSLFFLGFILNIGLFFV